MKTFMKQFGGFAVLVVAVAMIAIILFGTNKSGGVLKSAEDMAVNNIEDETVSINDAIPTSPITYKITVSVKDDKKQLDTVNTYSIYELFDVRQTDSSAAGVHDLNTGDYTIEVLDVLYKGILKTPTKVYNNESVKSLFPANFESFKVPYTGIYQFNVKVKSTEAEGVFKATIPVNAGVN